MRGGLVMVSPKKSDRRRGDGKRANKNVPKNIPGEPKSWIQALHFAKDRTVLDQLSDAPASAGFYLAYFLYLFCPMHW